MTRRPLDFFTSPTLLTPYPAPPPLTRGSGRESLGQRKSPSLPSSTSLHRSFCFCSHSLYKCYTPLPLRLGRPPWPAPDPATDRGPRGGVRTALLDDGAVDRESASRPGAAGADAYVAGPGGAHHQRQPLPDLRRDQCCHRPDHV